MDGGVAKALELLGKKEFARERDLLSVLPISRSTLLRLVKSKAFPAPRYLTPNIKYWLVRDVLAWARQQDRMCEE